MEEWRPITGYEGLYEVSSYGRVKKKDCILKNMKKKTEKGEIYIGENTEKERRMINNHPFFIFYRKVLLL